MVYIGQQTEKLGHEEQVIIPLTLFGQFIVRTAYGWQVANMDCGGQQTEKLGRREQELILLIFSTQFTMRIVYG